MKNVFCFFRILIKRYVLTFEFPRYNNIFFINCCNTRSTIDCGTAREIVLEYQEESIICNILRISVIPVAYSIGLIC